MNGQCYICERYGTAIQIVGINGKARHEDCYPGSHLWAEWYQRQPTRFHTVAGDILLTHYLSKQRNRASQ